MIVNLMPHPLRIYHTEPDEQGAAEVTEFPPSGQVARIGQIELGTQYLRGCDAPVEFVEYRHMNGLPAPVADTWYVVSLAAALAAAPGRSDLLVPYREVRNADGTVIGCRSLALPV